MAANGLDTLAERKSIKTPKLEGAHFYQFTPLPPHTRLTIRLLSVIPFYETWVEEEQVSRIVSIVRIIFNFWFACNLRIL